MTPSSQKFPSLLKSPPWGSLYGHWGDTPHTNPSVPSNAFLPNIWGGWGQSNKSGQADKQDLPSMLLWLWAHFLLSHNHSGGGKPWQNWAGRWGRREAGSDAFSGHSLRHKAETPSAKRRAFLVLRVRQGNGHVVMLTELGLSISMLSRVSFLALRWGLGIVKQGLVILFCGHRDGSSWEKSNSAKLLPLVWGPRLYFFTFVSSEPTDVSPCGGKNSLPCACCYHSACIWISQCCQSP